MITIKFIQKVTVELYCHSQDFMILPIMSFTLIAFALPGYVYHPYDPVISPPQTTTKTPTITTTTTASTTTVTAAATTIEAA